MKTVHKIRKGLHDPIDLTNWQHFGITIFAIIFFALPSYLLLTINIPNANQKAQGETTIAQNIEDQTKSQTLDVLAASDRLAKNPQTAGLRDTLKTKLEARRERMKKLLSDNPRAAEKIKLSQKQRDAIPQDLQQNVEQSVTIDGILKIAHSDNFTQKTNLEYSILTDSSGNSYELKYSGIHDDGLAGKRVRVKGIKLDNIIGVTEANNSKGSTQIQVLGSSTNKVLGVTTGPRRLAVIMLAAANSPNIPLFSANQVRNNIWTSYNSVNSFYKENSFGKISLTSYNRPDGDVYGWYKLPASEQQSDCSTPGVVDRWASEGEQLAQVDGFNQSHYDNIMFLMDSVSCGYSGQAYISGNEFWIYRTISQDTIEHELGHNLGYHHANFFNCLDQYNNRVSIYTFDKCTYQEYYDYKGGPMSFGGTIQLNSIDKGITGWLDGLRTQFITNSGTYSIAPIESSNPEPQSIIIHRVRDPGRGSLYLEYRQPVGEFDTFSPGDPVVNGIAIRYARDVGTGDIYPEGQFTELLDTTPLTSPFSDAYLAVGKTFQDPVEGISITTQSISSSRATVNITMNGPQSPCVQSNPTISISPVSAWGSPGQLLPYSIQYTNNDSSNCLASKFLITVHLPAGFIQSPSVILTSPLAPGASGVNTVNISSPSNAAPGFNTFTETIYNSSALSFTGSFQGNYNISAPISPTLTPILTPTPTPTPTPIPDTNPPTVSITNPWYGAKVGVNLSVNIKATATDNIGVSKVEFYIDSALKSTSTSAPYVYTWDTTGLATSSSHTITVKAYDASNNSSASTETVKMINDPDKDGFSTEIENYVGTDPNLACGTNAWPPDINNDGVVNTSDVLKFSPVFNSSAGDGKYDKRYDLNADGKIDTSDVLTLSQVFNKLCPGPLYQ